MNKTLLKTYVSITFIILTIIMIMQFAPFGNLLPFPGDLASQYLPFASLYQDFFKHPSEFFYSLHNGLGSATLTLFSYYLTSPFNLLLLLFKHKYLLQGLLIIVMLKIIMSSLSMTYYLQTQKQISSRSTVFLSISYSLCGFVSLYFYNILWLDVMIWLPLVVAGLERFITNRKVALYQWALFFLLLSSYYMGWMVCLFLGLYFFYFTGKYHHIPLKSVISKYWKSLLIFIGRSVSIVLCLGMIYVPTIIGMLQTGKGNFSFKNLWQPFFQSDFGALIGFGCGVANYTDRLMHYPTFYCGMAVLLMATATLISRKKTLYYDRMMLGILLLCTFVTPLTLMFQMFQPTAGFPFRFTYLISFMLIILASEIIDQLSQYKKELLTAGILWGTVFIALALLLPYLRSKMPVHPVALWVNICLIIIWTLLLTATMKKALGFLAISFLGIEVMIQTCWTLTGMPTIHQKNLEKYNQAMEQMLSTYPQTHKLQRLDNTEVNEKTFGLTVTGYNNGIWFNYPGTSSYTSTLTNENIDYAQMLGLYSRNERRFSNFGATPLSNALIGVNGQIVQKGQQLSIKKLPYSNTVHVLKENLDLKPFEAFNNQNKLAKSLGIAPVFKYETFKRIKQTKHSLTLAWTQKETGHPYIQLPNEKLKLGDAYHITVNHKKLHLPISIKNICILPLPHAKKGQTIKVTLSTHSNMLWKNIKVATFDDKQFEQSYQKITKAPLMVDQLENETTIKATKTNDKALVAIPYNKSFKATNNGKPVQVMRSDLGLVEIPLTKGENKIKLCYQPTAFLIGCVFSLIGLIIECMMIVRKRVSKNKA